MAKKDAREYAKFGDVYNFGWAAIAKLNERYEESTDANERIQIAQRVAEIQRLLSKVRDAEVVHIISSDNDPVKTLNAAVKQARKELQAMENLANALAAANRLLSLATRIISIVA